MFTGRKTELATLNNLYKSDRFECPVIYGRQRVGKTTLINEFCKDKKAIYFVAIESTMQNNLENLSKNVFSVTMPNFEAMPSFDKLDKLLDYLYSNEDKAVLYGITGGIPHYLARSDSNKSIKENIVENFFNPTGYFFEGPANLLK